MLPRKSLRSLSRLTEPCCITARTVREYHRRSLQPLSKALHSLALQGGSWLRNFGFLAPLSCLTTLSLRGCRGLKRTDELAALVSIVTLDLSDCDWLPSLSGLASLTKLATLRCGGCERLTDVAAVGGLVSLSHLELNECRSLVDCRALAELSNLTVLNVRAVTVDHPSSAGWTWLSSSKLATLCRLDIGLSNCPGPLPPLPLLRSLTFDGCTRLRFLARHFAGSESLGARLGFHPDCTFQPPLGPETCGLPHGGIY